MALHRRGRLLAALAVVAVSLAGAWWWQRIHRLSLPGRTLLIGFEHNPPYQVRGVRGAPTGLVIETVAEAARRARIPLEWRESPQGPDRALGSGAVDLWPLVTDLPERHRRLYISAPWLQSQHVLVLRGGASLPEASFAGPVSITAVALHVRLLHDAFPAAQPVDCVDGQEALMRLCRGQVAAAFLESRLALAVLREPPASCKGIDLQAHLMPGVHALGVGSTFAAAAAADRIRNEITGLAQDGTLAVLMARYSFFGLSDTRATYDLLEAQESNRRLLRVIGGLSLALALTAWLAWSLRATRRAAERARLSEREMLARYRAASRAASEVIWELDLATHEMQWSEAIESLYRAVAPGPAATLERWLETLDRDDAQRLGERIESLERAGAGRLEEELRLRRADGSPARVVARGFLVPGETGRPPRVIGALLDVTRRRELEEELLQAQKMEAVGRLAGGVAHDFNNLLTAIIACANLAGTRAQGDEKLAGYVREIDKAAGRAADLTGQLLAFSRRQVLNPEVISLNTVVAEMETLLRRLIGEQVELVVRLAPGLDCVRADRGQIGQVLMNLCLNARDAMPHGGRLLVETANVQHTGSEDQPAELEPGAYVAMSVSDEGVGMDPDTLGHLFEPFFTRKESGRGTGLGLSSSYGIVRQSAGQISVTSEVGRGSTFRVFLPRAEAPAATAAAGARPSEAERPRASGTIVVAEDEASVRELIASVLHEDGYTVLEARTGGEAVAICRAPDARADLLLIDVVLPDGDGPELAARALRAQPAMKVVYMTGYADDALLDRLGNARESLLAKPFAPEGLRRRVRETIGARNGRAGKPAVPAGVDASERAPRP